MGVRSVRFDVSWGDVEPSKGKINTPAGKLNTFKLFQKSGLRVKLIAGTIMAPPAWFLNSTPGSRLVDEDGRQSINTISYWLPGLTEYTEQAAGKIFTMLKENGALDLVDTVVVDMGPAGEPLYPPAWTQIADGLDVPAGDEKYWCYDAGAQKDFVLKMREKYRTIEAANAAWGKQYASFDALSVPKPRTVTGTMWNDVLTWYRDAKRAFVEKQIQAFKRVSEAYSGGRIRLLLYIPGSDVRDEWWDEAVRTGDGNVNVKIMADSKFMIQMAKKYNCLLQYTGVENEIEVAHLRDYMDKNGYGDIPLYGENAGSYECAKDPLLLARIIKQYRLAGIDYTHTRFLFKEDKKTPSEIMEPFRQAVAEISDYLNAR
jgi:hypothetical protein